MAYKLVKREFVPECAAWNCEYVLDSAADKDALPECAPGSTAMVAGKDGPLYMVNASGAWEEL
jgi:hypothetical protein